MNPADDAGVYRLDQNTALVLTVDFFTPIADDPYIFGAIAAANALSDVYAMGGRPLAALNICCFPPKGDKDVQRAILQGGADKIAEAGAVIAGGHSVRDDDLKYGLAVIGLVHPDRLTTKAGAKPGDLLVLTKPIGIGLLATARRKDAITEHEFAPALALMQELNRQAAQAMTALGAGGATDVTGFGLLGHAQEMAAASGVAFAIDRLRVPLLPNTQKCAQAGHVPGGARANFSHFGEHVSGLDDFWAPILFDPQTSGGLLISLPPESARVLIDKLTESLGGAGAPTGATLYPPAIIGEVLPGPAGKIIIR
jgi:selenide, water dikinase